MGSTRRRFTEEYKAQAVAFVVDDRRSVADVARNIGVCEASLGRWVAKARESADSDGSATGESLGESERAELIRLRAEAKDDKATIAELQMQVEFAKKVATWFAKDKQ
jgi:transposase